MTNINTFEIILAYFLRLKVKPQLCYEHKEHLSAVNGNVSSNISYVEYLGNIVRSRIYNKC